jgi:hypothetical protein
VRAAIEKSRQDDGRALLRIVAANAFNKVSCAAMLDSVLTHVPGMAQMAYAVYGQPPLLNAGDNLFNWREGARQDCQLSMILCCVAKHPTVEKIEAKCNLDANMCIADDGSLYCKIDQLLLAIDIILEAEETTGYRMNKTKSSLWNLRMNIQRLALLGCQLAVDTNGTPVPGSRHCSYWILYWVLRIRLGTAARQEGRDGAAYGAGPGLRIPQLAYHLLPVYLSVPYLVHAAHTTPPNVIEPFVAEFDASLRRVFAESICSLTDAGWSKIELPFRGQGGGFADLGSILRPAYTASIMDAIPTRALLSHNPTPLPSSSPSLHHSGTFSQTMGSTTNQTFNLQTFSPETAKHNQQSAVL